ncbi:MAG TPA: hypothetical protein VJ719_03125 [Chthoniobacterales bacterium]|nr:hypothetical protein [Chthoniobacterales bacterium]
MKHQESTYALLVRSEEKSRGVLETVAYSSILLSVVIAIWTFVEHPVTIPAAGIEPVIASEIALANSPS